MSRRKKFGVNFGPYPKGAEKVKTITIALWAENIADAHIGFKMMYPHITWYAIDDWWEFEKVSAA
jgi:hypothetical protein